MESFLIKAAQLLLSLSILVVLHELGHFIPARLFKIRVEKFYLFFDPWFSLFKKKIGGTEYGIGWLPLGGYVKISGMVDESMDKDQLNSPPQPHEFRSKPAWQRLIVMVGGVTVNLLLGIFIYMMILFSWGREYLPLENISYGLHADSLMLAHGFQDGDKIVSVGGIKPETLSDVSKMIIIEGHRTIQVERNKEIAEVILPQDIDQTILDAGHVQLFSYRIPVVIDSVLENTPAHKAGLMSGDYIVEVNGEDARYFENFRRMIAANTGKLATFTILREGNQMKLPVEINDDGVIGVFNTHPATIFKFEKEDYSLLEAIPAGFNHGINTLASYVESMKLVFSEAGVKQMGGFGAIGGLFDSSWNWQRFWEMTAFISIILAFMNILPIPALDGGHVMFLLYEMISGRSPNQKVMEYAQMVGMILLLVLVLYANGNDIFKALIN